MDHFIADVGRKPRRRDLFSFSCLLLPLLLLPAAGCARVGPPRPPYKRVPPAVKELAVAQEGPDLVLRFTLPVANADGSRIEAYPALEIDGLLLPATNRPADWNARKKSQLSLTGDRFPATPAKPAVQIRVNLAREMGGVEGMAVVAVRFTNEHRHWSAFSPSMRLRVAPVAEAAGEVKWRQEKTGVTLEWEAPRRNFDGSEPAACSGTRIFRRELPERKFLPVGEVDAETRRYTDTTIRMDARYEYTLAFFRKLDGGTAQGGLSAPVLVDTRDIVPPDIPAQLSLVLSDGRIMLIWSPVRDPDLAGYLVFRREEPRAEPKLLTPQPIPYASFTDPEADPAAAHWYQMLAVDGHGNRSPLSAEAAWVPEKK